MSKITIEKEILEESYNRLQSIIKVGKELNIGKNTVQRLLKEHQIKTIGSQGARKHCYNEDYFHIINTQEKAYWLGFIMADGGIYKGSDEYSLRLQINLKESDYGHLEKFQKAINSNYKISHNKKTNSVSLKINSTKLCKDLISHNIIQRKSLLCKYPVLDKDLDVHFIRGVFDGDGCISLKKNNKCTFSIVSGSEDFILALKDKIPFHTNIYIANKKANHMYYLSISKLTTINDIYNWLYKDSNIYLERKHDIFLKFAKNIMSPMGVIS